MEPYSIEITENGLPSLVSLAQIDKIASGASIRKINMVGRVGDVDASETFVAIVLKADGSLVLIDSAQGTFAVPKHRASRILSEEGGLGKILTPENIGIDTINRYDYLKKAFGPIPDRTGGGGVNTTVVCLGVWQLSDQTAAADPGAGVVRFQTYPGVDSATDIYLSMINQDGVSRNDFIAAVAATHDLYFEQVDDPANNMLVNVTDNTDNTGWWTIGIDTHDLEGAFATPEEFNVWAIYNNIV